MMPAAPVTTTLVTGADRGLGAALAQAAAARGDRVWAACLGDTPEFEPDGVAIIPRIDVTSDAAIERLVPELGDVRLDRVFSNAGVNLSSGGPGDADTEAMARELNVNVLGAVRVVRTVLPLLAPGARIAFTSTGRGAAYPDPDPAHGMNYGYRITKAALNVYGGLVAQDLAAAGHIVALLNPGPINTALMRRIAAAGGSEIDPESLPAPEDVAPGLLTAVDELAPERSGSWIGPDGTEV
jgi:NAD(P)-dependent dehydrogenase (short-subunit alcohol dehydrogenase family)